MKSLISRKSCFGLLMILMLMFLHGYAYSAISISEIMYDAGPRQDLPLWIELYNSSLDRKVNLAGWTLEIRNAEGAFVNLDFVNSAFKFDQNTIIQPNETLLIVSLPAANTVQRSPVYDLSGRHGRALGLTEEVYLLSSTGFQLTLLNKQGIVADTVGNLRVDGDESILMWALPQFPLISRRSIVRGYGGVYGTLGFEHGTGPHPANDGYMRESWRVSDGDLSMGGNYYGNPDDVGTPGFRLGGPLPVSLSSFRPVRSEQTGHVDITWVTQSELNNAGFNILRSDSKDGEFKVINVKGLIAGHGTTSERHVYTYTDTTAKPNVVYYYQIEDVSFDGKRTTLRTTHLRGNVAAAGKITTTWGDLKLQK